MISKKGFTLFEVLLVITIMAIISIAALTSTINTQKQFVFINTFKELLTKVREARLYTVTQKSIDLDGSGTDMGIPSAYGLHIERNGNNIVTTVFADLADVATQNEFDTNDVVIGTTHFLDATKYTLTLNNSEHNYKKNPPDPLATLNADNVSLTLLYPPGEIKVIASYENIMGSHIITNPYIYLGLKDNKLDLTKNIFIFLRSGIAEEIQDPTALIQ